MYFALSVKNVEFETAAMPSMKFERADAASSITPAKSTQPSPGCPRTAGAHRLPSSSNGRSVAAKAGDLVADA